MIINGGPRSNSAFYAWHLMRADTNERVTIAEIRGFVADDIDGALQEAAAVSRGTRCKNFFYAASISPRADETLTAEQWQTATDQLERNLGLTGHARIVVEHEKEARIHRHVLWSRVDTETMRVVDADFNYAVHSQTSRELEEILGLAPLVVEPRAERGPKDYETFRATDTGIDPRAMKAEITALWQEADSGLAFHAALTDAGYFLARGDRRDFVIVDPAGDDHSLARRIAGAKAADIRARLADVDRDSLPSVAEARELARAAADSADATTPQETALDAAPGPIATEADRAAQRAGALSDVTAEITPDVENDLAKRFGDRNDAPRQTLDDREQAHRADMQEREEATRGTPDDWKTKQPGQAGDRREEFTAWERFANRMRAYAERAWEILSDESSGKPEAERGPWQRLVGAARHLVRGYAHRDLDELWQGATEIVDLIRGDEAGGSKPSATGDSETLPTDNGAAERARGEEVLRRFDAEPGEHSPPDTGQHREQHRPDAQVEVSEPQDDRPQPETPAVTEPMTEFDRMRAAYFEEWDAGEDAELPPEAEPPDTIQEPEPEPPDHDAPDMD